MLNIVSTKDIASKRITCIVYGDPGVGKTRLVKTVPGKALILDAESGLLSLSGTNIHSVPVKSWEGIREITANLTSDHYKNEYQWLFIDSLTEISQLLMNDMKIKYPKAKDGFPMWNEYAEKMTKFIKAYRDFTPYNIVFTALVKTATDEFNRTSKRVNILKAALAEELPGVFDLILYHTTYKGDDGNYHEGLLTVNADGIIAKDRSGKLAQPYEEPNFTTIYNKIIKTKKEN